MKDCLTTTKGETYAKCKYRGRKAECTEQTFETVRTAKLMSDTKPKIQEHHVA